MALTQGRLPPAPLKTRPPLNILSGFALATVGILAVIAAAAAVVLMQREPARAPHRDTAPVAVLPLVERDGPWQRIAVDPPMRVADLRATSFGLVAAAGEAGIWMSEDGTDWHQSMRVNGRQVPEYGEPETTAPAPPSGVWESVEVIAEFDSALYAFGRVIREINIESEAWLVAWRSDDGTVWERVNIARSWDQLMDVAVGPNGMTLFGRSSREAPGGRDCCFASIYQSADGRTWEDRDAWLSGLEGIQIWAATAFDGGFLAIGSEAERDIILRSVDATTWREVADWQDAVPARWRFAELHRSAWSIVDLFAGPEGAVAVLYSDIPHSLVLLVSADGERFEEFAAGNRLLTFFDHRETVWPPLAAPEGAADGDDIVLLGEWFPWSEDEPCTHLWRWSPPEVLEPALHITIRE